MVAGEKREYLILKIADGEMTLSVPTDKAEEVGMRPPISAEDVDDLFQLLGKKDVREPDQLEPAVQEPPGEVEERRRVPGRRSGAEPRTP